jgi:hypothetical protein
MCRAKSSNPSGHLAAGLGPRGGRRPRGASPAAKWVWAAAFVVLGFLQPFHATAAGLPREIDARRLAAAGLRVLEGRFVRLVTDLPSSPAVDDLPTVFDAAVPQWAAYFDVPMARLDGARWLGFLIEDREKFTALGLLPAERPDFLSGYANGWEFWLVEQPSDYYRRHLVLHEGTHAFMQSQLGGAGAPWYMEGMAELLGTHNWSDGKLRLRVIPASRDDVPMWGRTKLVRDAVAEDKAWPIERVLAVDNSRSMPTDEYAWTWALTALLDGHPRYQERFRELRASVADRRFTERFRQLFADGWAELHAEWEAFVAGLDYGYDIPTMALVHAESAPVEQASRRSTILANRGWQSAGWVLRAGVTYRVEASGRYQLTRDGETWSCEPGGVTIEYREGAPVGALLGALVYADGGTTFATPRVVGLGTTVRAPRDAVLYLRVNDAARRVGKNVGKLEVRIDVGSAGDPPTDPRSVTGG